MLTGFPPPHRAAPALVDTWLDDRFANLLPPPNADEVRKLVRLMAREGRSGGAIYDALVAQTAKLEELVLVTADVRAAATYELVGVEFQRLVSG